MLPLISIIVPVYNKKIYIKSCIESILRQTYKNIEVILVDDGSTDGSDAICDTYNGIENKVYVYHKLNSGVSNTRNFGVSKAHGQFICFVDADDSIANNYVEKLYEKLVQEKVDIVICSVKEVYYENGKKVKEINKILNEQKGNILNDLEQLYYNKNFYMGGIYLKIYKSDIIKNNNLKFREDLNFGEDYIFNLEYFKLINNYCTIPDLLYTYKIYPKTENAKERLNKNRIENERKILQITQQYIKSNNLQVNMLYSESIRIIEVFFHILNEDKNIKFFEKLSFFNKVLKELNVSQIIKIKDAKSGFKRKILIFSILKELNTLLFLLMYFKYVILRKVQIA